MNVVLWILQIVLGLVMAMAGGMKVMSGKDKLLEDPRMAFRGGGRNRACLPVVVRHCPGAHPLAALGVLAIQLGAAATHMRRQEMQMVAMNAMLGLLALVVAIGRFGDL